MTFYGPPWQQRPSQPKPQPREPTLGELALGEMMARDEPEAPFGGWAGEIAVAGPQLQPPPPQRLEFSIPPADWDEEERERQQRERERLEREAAAERERRLAAEIAAVEQPQAFPAKKNRR